MTGDCEPDTCAYVRKTLDTNITAVSSHDLAKAEKTPVSHDNLTALHPEAGIEDTSKVFGCQTAAIVFDDDLQMGTDSSSSNPYPTTLTYRVQCVLHDIQ